MKRIPLIPTVVVTLAVAAMIALGFWQLQRLQEKEALLAVYAHNEALPAIALPQFPDDRVLFRKASAICLEPVRWEAQSGRDAKGRTGWRQIAQCRTGAEGPGFWVQVGVATDPGAKPVWRGGPVSGYVTHAPDHRPLIAGIFDHTPKALMIVADTPLPGLAANSAADLSAVPNNHLAYAVQWFLFAGIAAIIYALALRRRLVAARRPR
ncbi:SURF1-like protein [Sphingomonas sp. EC-HK361]|uniref:SURF1 family protein n=1 Tax=Sphingomonas sp. EC-HK361 TaxID=2038397 RepID=UPI0012513EAC|nr:SURF1 family protein [Sphingomonas sp. EC-HK361]VVT18895.1 SURF1-like protein [Sphingomonas sp. EC-HK361]